MFQLPRWSAVVRTGAPAGVVERVWMRRPGAAPMVSQVAYERLEEKLNTTQEMLEDALAEHAEESP